MGGWDVHCAFCGGPFTYFDPFNEEGSTEGEAYNPELIREQDLKWLEKVQVLGFNPDSFTIDKCFITGLGEVQDYGEVICQPGDDPNVPTRRAYAHLQPGRVSLNVYRQDPDEAFSITFHPPCLRVFAQALRHQLSGETRGLADTGDVDKSILYTTVSGLHEDYHHALKLDYGEPNEIVTEQYWGCMPGHEAWVSNPFQHDKISQYFKVLKDNEPIAETSPQKPSRSLPTSFKSPLTKVADEIVLEILLYLKYDDIRSFVLSRLTPINLSQAQGYWKRKIPIDMPFLWDLPELDGPRNFFQIYHELRRQSFATTPPIYTDDEGNDRVEGPRDKTLVLGLANRRRVWNTCSRLAELYAEQQKELELKSGDNRGISQEIVNNSVSSQMPLVAFPVSMNFRQVSTVELETAGTNGSKLLGEKASGSLSLFTAHLPAGGWLTGFELNIGNCHDAGKDPLIGITGVKLCLRNGFEYQVNDNNGGKRQMTACDGMVITGAVAEIANGVIQRLGLLQCPQTRTSAQHSTLSQIEKCLWKSFIPPHSLAASTYETGYWTPIRSLDTIPMDALVFGTTDNDLAQITGFSSDAEKRSFGIHYRDGSSKYIGPDTPSPTTKVFRIDGKGGERVAKVEVGMNSLPMAIKIRTNRDRHFFFGRTQKNWHITYEPRDDAFVAGIYASWGYSSGGGPPECTTISILSGSKSIDRAVEVAGVKHMDSWAPLRPNNSGLIYNPRNAAVVNEDDYEDYSGKYW